MRTFIAIEFNAKTRKDISVIQDQISEEAKRGGTYTYVDNLHLTLHFLGEISESDLSDAAEAVASTAAMNRAFKLNFNKVGFFDRGEKCILWLGVDKSKSLVRLHDTLERNLLKQGFRKDKGNFTPHITLAREIAFYSNKQVAVDKLTSDIDEVEVKEISLMESRRVGGKLVYKKLYGAKLI